MFLNTRKSSVKVPHTSNTIWYGGFHKEINSTTVLKTTTALILVIWTVLNMPISYQERYIQIPVLDKAFPVPRVF